MNSKKITAVVGGQYGSEGKGAIVGHIATDYDAHVRVGAANAGHTVYVQGERHVLQQLPVAAYANPEAELAIGPGALISLGIFMEEFRANREWRRERNLPKARVLVDYRAHIITPEQVEREQQGDLAERIGSTSTIAREGIGASQAARVSREKGCATVAENDGPFKDAGMIVADVPHWIYTKPDHVLLEGTQGTGLSLTTGDFPYVTSRNPTAAGLCADCGVGPRDLDNVILVMRTYPIRVHGNSGPFYLGSTETSWTRLGVPPERTTVTKLERRVATFSMDQAEDACRINSANMIALTFVDYMAPRLKGIRRFEDVDYTDPDMIKFERFMRQLENRTAVPVAILGTGPDSVIERLPEHDLEGVPVRV